MERYTQLLFKTKHPSWMLFVVLGLAVIAVLVFVIDGRPLATQVGELPSITPSEGPVLTPEDQAVEYVSNELLIKIKSPQHKRIKQNPKPEDTGLASLNKLNKEHGVQGFGRVAKPSKKSKDPNHDVFRWYKITLPGEQEIIKEEASQPVFEEERELPQSGEVINPKAKNIKSILARYQQDSNIETAELNYIVRTAVIPNDTYADPEQDGTWSSGSWGQSYEDLWGLKKIEADKAWDISTGSEDIIVAVIDTGIDYNHPDIVQNIWTNPGEIPDNGIDDDNNCLLDDYYGFDFVNSVDGDGDGCYDGSGDVIDSDPMDDNGHGTAVAGIIGAAGNNGIGIAGLSWTVKIMSLKTMGSDGRGSAPNHISALVYATDNGARIINMSFGSSSSFPFWPMRDAIQYAYSQNVVLVAGAGNDSAEALNFYPAGYHEVISVGASSRSDLKLSYSNFGSKVDVSAPGTMLLTLAANSSGTIGGGAYRLFSGTSGAAPHVSGLAALLLARDPLFTNEDIRHIIRASADQVDVPGIGRINAFKALQISSAPRVELNLPLVVDVLDGTDQLVISGTAGGTGFVGYELTIGEGSDPNVPPIFTVSSSSSPVIDGVLGTLTNLESLDDGVYILKLAVTDQNGVTFWDWRVLVRERFVQPLSAPQQYHSNLSFSDNKVVWGEPFKIKMHDLLTGNTRTITQSTSSAGAPDVSEDYVVWQDYRNGNWDVYLYTLDTDSERNITAHPASQIKPRVSGNRIVWEDYRNGADSPAIYVYDIDSDTERAITNESASQHGAQISDNFIVWRDERTGNSDVFLYDLTNGQERQITSDDDYQFSPDVDGDYVVWSSYYDTDIFLYNLRTSGLRKITFDGSSNVRPRISHNTITWVKGNVTGNFDIYSYNLSTDIYRRITWNPRSQAAQATWGDKIVWRDARDQITSTEYRIYIYDPPPAPPCGSYGDVDNDGFVTQKDVDLVTQYDVGLISLTPYQKIRADVDGNRVVDAIDELFILQFVNSVRENFPVCMDSDNDGFTDAAESFMGTDPLLACGANAWPPDFNDDGVVHIDDVSFVAARFGAREGDPSYTKRAELASQDGVIHIDDVSKVAGAFGTSCNAP